MWRISKRKYRLIQVYWGVFGIFLGCIAAFGGIQIYTPIPIFAVMGCLTLGMIAYLERKYLNDK